MIKKLFPKNFYWGVATAAHQIEGDMDNDWVEWEKNTAKHRAQNAKEDYRKQSAVVGEFPEKKWEKVELEASYKDNYLSGKAANHRGNYKKELDLLKDLSANSYRFSIEWSRIEPEEGVFSEEAIEYYRDYLNHLKKIGVEPFVTLWHFTNPKWFTQNGSWTKSTNLKFFLRFVEKMVTEFEDVKYWIILNEPVNYSLSAHLAGIFPPAQKNLFSTISAISNFKSAHNQSYKLIKKLNPDAIVGSSINFSSFYAKSRNPFFRILRKIMDELYNHNFVRSIKANSDFLGVNYYTTVFVENFVKELLKIGNGVKNDNYEISDLGWYLNPQGFFEILSDLDSYKLPLYITEHGIADSEDSKRGKYIVDSLNKVHESIESGVDIRGYFHWTFFDNYEWDKGFWPKFGLYETDFETMKKTPRKSAGIFEEIAKTNSIEV